MSDVYFSKKIESLFEHFPENLNGRTGIKVHFGEEGNETFIPAEIVKKIYLELKRRNPRAEIKLIESNVLYRGSRTKTEEHIQTAKKHGFDFAPIEILDDKGEIKISENLMHFKEVKAGKGIKDFENLIVISHVKGHCMNGFGGALKNVGMGIASRGGKLALHSSTAPRVNWKCSACGKCIEECPVKAIKIEGLNLIKIGKKARINNEKCIGCAHCIAICPQGAIEIPWGSQTSKDLQEKIDEYCFGILKGKKSWFINWMGNITKDCDCIGRKQEKETGDIGFLFSRDIVSIDKASFDLIGKETFKKMWPNIDSEWQFEYAEKIKLGERKNKIKNE
jgi:uncharacterized Fe-S center protein